MPHERLRWKVDHEKSVLLTNFERRGWCGQARAADEEFPGSSWNVYWASPNSIKHIFNPENNIRLGDHQLVNHFPNHFELTRKDLMVKNLKRYRRELEKVLAEQREGGAPSAAERDLDCIPTTFILPGDFALLAEEFKRSPGFVCEP